MKQKKTKALIDAEKIITQLSLQLETAKKEKDDWYKKWRDHEEVLNGLHEVLDDMGIRGHRENNQYQRIPLTVRLFAWALNATKKDLREVK